jgi:probable F420-dependent oxidoreductase
LEQQHRPLIKAWRAVRERASTDHKLWWHPWWIRRSRVFEAVVRLWLRAPQTGVAIDTAEVRAAASLADELATGLWVGDHLALPIAYRTAYPYGQASPTVPGQPLLECFTLLSFLAGITRRARLLTAITVMPFRHPVLLARMSATLDVLSGGRLELGLGSGWLREEFDALSIAFADRGAMTDEYIEVVRRLWSGEPVTYHGRFVDLDEIVARPIPTQTPEPPLWIGGDSKTARRRAARLGVGWAPLRPARAHLAEAISEFQATRASSATSSGSMRVCVVTYLTEDKGASSELAQPIADSELSVLRELQLAGVTDVLLHPRRLPREGRLDAVTRVLERARGAGLSTAKGDDSPR